MRLFLILVNLSLHFNSQKCSDYKFSICLGAKKKYDHPAKSLQDKITFSFQL